MRWIFWSYYSVFVHEDFYPHLMMKLLITLYIFTLYPGWRKSVLALYGFFSFLLFFFTLLFQLEIGILYFTPLHSYFFFFSSPHQFLFKYFCFICIRDLYIRYFRGSSSSKPEKPEKYTIRTSDKCHENNLIFFFSLVRSTFAFYYCFITIFGWSDILQIFPGRPQFQFLAFQHFKDHSSEQRFLCKLLTKCSWCVVMQEKYFLLGACLLRHSVTERDCIEHETWHWERYQDVTSVIGMAGGGKCSSVREMILVTLWRGMFVNQHCTYIHVLSNSVQNF